VAGAVDRERLAKEYLEASARTAAELVGGDVPALAARAGSFLARALAAGGKVRFCGNGGSAADAQHLAAELVGRLDRGRERRPLAGLALTTDTSVLTALANDFGYDEVFARQLAALGRPGDVLVCLSTSGASANVLRAVEAARAGGLRIVALVGPGRSPLDGLADVVLHVPGVTSGHIQQGHITLGHLLCELAEAGP
jgi:D-sedoheptulose 7-phosphate isomerase